MLLGLGLFFFGYLISMIYTSIFYHRALCHGSISLTPRMAQFIDKTGMLITGIDPKGWVCMHRLHHLHSDTPLDPHSPKHTGFLFTFIKQHKSYEKILSRLVMRQPKVDAVVSDIPFDVHYLNRKQLWWVPFAYQAIIGVILSLATHNAFAGIGYFIGICGHPLQGFMVNAFGHAVGYRNFNCPDQSTNNTFVALTCFGEGYQNNHHQYPSSPKFAMRRSEFDVGYLVAQGLQMAGLLKLKKELIPKTEVIGLELVTEAHLQESAIHSLE